MFIWELLYFAIGSIVTGTVLDLISCDESTRLVSLIGWKIPNYIVSSVVYLYAQGLVNKQFRKVRKSNYNIINFRSLIIRDVTDALTMIGVNLFISIASPMLMHLGFIGTMISSYINAMMVYEFRLNHIPTIMGRLQYYKKDPAYMIMFGYPLSWIINHEQVTWFTIHHAYNIALTFYVGLVWHIAV